MKRMMTVCGVALLVVSASTAWADKKSEKRKNIDEVAQEVMSELFEASSDAKDLSKKSYGHAVFSNLKVAVGISGGGGSGVAVTKSGDRTYMKMGTAGVGLGLGGQSYQVVFLFDTEKALKLFIEKGWHADATASAVVWNNGKNADATFNQGLAVFQVTNKGLMAAVDISGTKYWKSKKLNR